MPFLIATTGALTLDWIEAASGRKGPFYAGNALYAAVGAWLASAIPLIVARAGRDYRLHEIETAGFSTDHIRSVSSNAFRVLIEERAEGRRLSYLADSGNNAGLDAVPQDLPASRLDGVHVGPARPAVQALMLEASRDRGCFSTLDMLTIPGALEPTAADLDDLLPLADAFLPSLNDLQCVWPSIEPKTAIDRLVDIGCRIAVLKLGAKGCIGTDGRTMVSIPAIETRLTDPTGAGDAFCGAFHAAWLKSRDLVDAMSWGTAAASIVIGGYGALHAATSRSLTEAQRRHREAIVRAQCDAA